VNGLVTGAPATAGHLNIWETPVPLIQLTGAASAAIVPQSADIPLSIAYLGGARFYLLYAKRVQTNFGIMVGGSNGGMNLVPSFSLRASDLSIWSHKVAFGFEFRSPIEFFGGPTPIRWRLWGALTITIEKPNESKIDRVHATQARPSAYDLVRSRPETAPPVQTAWETTL
jgi:hypothetical protein